MLPRRFHRDSIDPALLATAEIGELFQTFVWKALSSASPGLLSSIGLEAALLSFVGIGKDGAIDLSATTGDVRLVIESKYIGDGEPATVFSRWSKTARNLERNLSGPSSGEAQYGPWRQIGRAHV